MKAAVKNIIYFVVSLAGALLLGYFTFAFGESSNMQYHYDASGATIVESYPHIVTDLDTNTQKLTYTMIASGSTAATSSSGVVNVDFGRLASALLLPDSGADYSELIQPAGSGAFILGPARGVISLYDPFSLHSIRNADNTVNIEQITNGSFYMGKEADNTITLYSIDIVMQIDFLVSGQKVTSMILFPGMYIRFDPSHNDNLKNADLFRIVLSLGDETDTGSTSALSTTGIEFANFRTTTPTGYAFGMYRLPIDTRVLFQILHVFFDNRVNSSDLKQFATSSAAQHGGVGIGAITNPSKKAYLLLEQLQGVLAHAVNSQMTPDEFRRQFDAIYQASQGLMAGNMVQRTLETFLIDGRFATFGDITNKSYKDIYTTAASIVGISPTKGKGELFQSLADIYSKNIIDAKQDPVFPQISTFTQTAYQLRLTLDNNLIAPKDFFDIALYAFNILKKTENNQKFVSTALESTPLYDLVTTVFAATNKYAMSITDPTEQIHTYKSIVIHFYAPLLSTLVHSLYSHYTIVENDQIFLDPTYLDGDVPQLSPTLTKAMINTESVITNIQNQLSVLIDQNIQDSYALTSFNASVQRLSDFTALFADAAYKNYKKHPYTAVLVNGVNMPVLAQDVTPSVSTTATGATPAPAPVVQTTQKPVTDPQLQTLQTILGTTITQDMVQSTGDGYHIKGLTFHSAALTYQISADYAPQGMLMSNVVLQTGDRTIQVDQPPQSISAFRGFLAKVPLYIQYIQQAVTNASSSDPVVLTPGSNQISIGTQLFSF